MRKIQTVIFDVGGVLHESTDAAVMSDLRIELGISQDVLASILNKEMILLGSGKIDENEFWDSVSVEYGLRKVDIKENLLSRIFVKNIIPILETRKIVDDLSKIGIKTAILSNTIEPHAKALREANLYKGFDAVLLSHEIGLRKPNEDAYKYALEALKATSGSTVFVDDDPVNVRAASLAGIHSIVFSNTTQLRGDLRSYIPDF